MSYFKPHAIDWLDRSVNIVKIGIISGPRDAVSGGREEACANCIIWWHVFTYSQVEFKWTFKLSQGFWGDFIVTWETPVEWAGLGRHDLMRLDLFEFVGIFMGSLILCHSPVTVSFVLGELAKLSCIIGSPG
jgi:hypothetical protein